MEPKVFRRGDFLLVYDPAMARELPEDTLTGDAIEGMRKGWSLRDILLEMIRTAGADTDIDQGSPSYHQSIAKFYRLIEAGNIDEAEAVLASEVIPIINPESSFLRVLLSRIESEREWQSLDM